MNGKGDHELNQIHDREHIICLVGSNKSSKTCLICALFFVE